MPLKHHTETALIIVLAGLILLTGVLVSTLPLLPIGLVPWGIVFLATLLYPLAVYPLLKRNRADYEFRILHFAPAVIALLWFLIQIASLKSPWLLRFGHWYTWGHSFFPVTVALVLLAAFCLQVIRRRVPRLATMVSLFALFLVLAAVTESGARVDSVLADVLWNTSTETGAIAGTQTSSTAVVVLKPGSGKNLAQSHDSEEEAWRARLRAVEAQSSSRTSSSKALASLTGSGSSKSSRPILTEKPHRLPGSGFGMELLTPLFMAGYLGTVHRRAKKRSQHA